MVDSLPLPYFGKDFGHLIQAVRRRQDRHRFANDFGGGVAEDALRAAIPTSDDAV